MDLAGPEWDEDHNNNIGMAEWPRTATAGPAIAILFGSYDWQSEADPATGTPSTNGFRSNTERLTRNTIKYLSK